VRGLPLPSVETTVCDGKGAAVDRCDWMFTNNRQDHSELRRTQAALCSTSNGVADHCMPRRIAADGQQTPHRRSGLSYSGHAQPPRLRCDTVSVAHGRRRRGTHCAAERDVTAAWDSSQGIDRLS
jgi:hypothetical protein